MANSAPFPARGETPYSGKVKGYIDSGDADAKNHSDINDALHRTATDPHTQYQTKKPTPLGAPVNLNSVLTSGRYDHGYNASNQNVPILDGGYLDVQVHSSGLVSQRWESAAGRTFTRRRNAAQVWQPWVEESMLTHESKADPHPTYLLKAATTLQNGTLHNLNLLRTTGNFYVPYHEQMVTNGNAPSGSSGWLTVVGNGTAARQTYSLGATSAADMTYERGTLDGTSWSAWRLAGSRAVDAHLNTADPHSQYLLKNALPIGDGTNLDTLTAPGNFVRATSIGSTTALNYPTSEWAGFVEVLANENRSFVVQRATFYSNTVATPVPRVRVWTRSRIGTSAAFGPWLLDDAAPWIITGHPENVVAAPVGTIAVDKNATNGAVQWVKASGAGATGWKVTHGDTGWRTLPLPDNLTMVDTAAPYYQIRRINETVHFRIRVKAAGALLGTPRSSVFTLMTIPSSPVGFLSSNYVAHGIASIGTSFLGIVHTQSALPNLQVAAVGQTGVWGNTNPDIISASFSYLTDTNWPTVLPGTAA